MKTLRFLAFFLALTCSILSTQSCKDACKDVICLNEGICNEGDCDCTDGFTGLNCENNNNSFTINDSTYILTAGYLEEYGVNPDGSFDFDITLTSSGVTESGGDLFGSGAFVYLDLNTMSENNLDDGTYTYSDGERKAFDLSDGVFSPSFDFSTGAGGANSITGGTVEVKVVGPVVTVDFDLQSPTGNVVGNYSGTLKPI